MLVSSKGLLEKARRGNYAVGQFNVYNLESAQAAIKAAEEERAPIILGITPKSIDYGGLEELALIIKSLAKKTKVPIVLHLDHAFSLDQVKAALRAGFTSVMFDGSAYNLETNIELTRKAATLAHRYKAAIEGEVGRLGLIKGKPCSFTDPGQAKEFVANSRVDALAIAVGTSHGAYKFIGRPFLDLKRIRLIGERIKIPLVLHGASSVTSLLVKRANRYGASLKHTSGIPHSLIKKAIEEGICKINIDTDLRLVFVAKLRERLTKARKEIDPREILRPVYTEMTKLIREKIKLFGSNNKI